MTPEEEREMYEEMLREGPVSSAENVRRDLREVDTDVSLHARIEAAIEDTTWGEAVTAAAVTPVDYLHPVTTFALGAPGEALKAAVGDSKPRLIVGKLLVGEGGGDLLAISGIIAADVREE